MNTQPATPITDVDGLYGPQAGVILQTTLFVEDVDTIQAYFGHRLKKQPELRRALYEVARQNAHYRLSLAPDQVLPLAYNPHRIDELYPAQKLEVLKQTVDVREVDQIEFLTESRLGNLPEFRKELFDIARLGVEYRLAARQQVEVAAQ